MYGGGLKRMEGEKTNIAHPLMSADAGVTEHHQMFS